MSKPDDKKVVSLTGGPILRHGDAAGWRPPRGETHMEQISEHVARHLGPVDTVLHELASDTVHIDVHVVRATVSFPYCRVVTSGMSDLAMSTPGDVDAPRHAELMMTLPGFWRLDKAAFEDESWYWPIRLIKMLARFPHKYYTWLGWGHTVPNGDPPQPYAPNTKLSGAILLEPASTSEDFHTLVINASKKIAILAVMPLYVEEMNLKLRSGALALVERFSSANMSDIIDPGRVNVAKKRFGFL